MSAGRGLGSLSGLAIRRPVTTAMVFVGLGLLGLISYRQLPVQLFPDFELPQLWVSASWRGASPEVLEEDVLRVLEGELAGLGGIEEMESVARPGSATITLSFERGVDLDHASLRAQQRLAAARPRLPEQVFLDLQRFDTRDWNNAVMLVSVRGDADLETMARIAEDTVVPLLEAVDGVVRVDVQGGASKQLGVFVDPDQAQARGVSVVQVQDALGDATRPVQSVGSLRDGGRSLPVVIDGRARRISDVAEAPVDSLGRVRLAHVADIQPGIAGSTRLYRVNGRTSVGMFVFKDQQSNLLRVSSRLHEKIEEFNSEQGGGFDQGGGLEQGGGQERGGAEQGGGEQDGEAQGGASPGAAAGARAGLHLAVDFDAAEVIDEHLSLLIERGTTGALLALIVLLVFLRGIHPGLIVGLGAGVALLSALDMVGLALALVVGALVFVRGARAALVVVLAAPVSLLIACALFKAGGLSLNILTLLGLALSIGMLLDNAIVVLESIAARRQAGEGPLEAARQGASRVQRAVLAGTLTTIVVFVPLYVVETELGPLLRELALAVSFPLVASLLVAVALVPVAVSRLGAGRPPEPPTRLPGEHGVPRPDEARSLYSALLRAVLRAPGLTMVGFFLLVLVSIVAGAPFIAVFASAARPPEDRIRVEAELPEGSTDEQADELARQVERLAAELPEVDEVQVAVRDELATVTIVFNEAEERTQPVHVGRARERLKRQLDEFERPGTEIEVDPPAQQGAGASPLGDAGGTRETVRVIGPGGAELLDLARRTKERLEQVPGLTGVSWDVAGHQPTLEIRPDRVRLAEHGLTSADLMRVVWAAQREGTPTRYPFRLGDEDVDLVLWVEGGNERTVEGVRDFPLTTPLGGRVPMSAVSTVTTGSDTPELHRWQRERTVTITYGFERRVTASGSALERARADVDRAIATLATPAGHHVFVEHADDELAAGWKMGMLALALVFVVLAITFESLVQPLLILVCVPLAAVPGVIWALVITGTGVDELVLLAFVVLLGVVVNNGVLLVDRSQALLAEGARRPTAVMRAAHERLRPVLMTAATTVIGMLPLAVDTGGSQESWPPFARAVIGGLLASTVISLVLVPAGILVLGRLGDLLETLGPALSVLGLGLTAALCWWLYVVSELVVANFLRIVLVPPLLLGAWGLLRVLQRLVRGERPPELVGEGPVRLRVRSARKVYGGLPRIWRELRRGARWREMAHAAGLGQGEIQPPAHARRQLAWQLLLLGLLAYLHVLAESTWGLALLLVPFLVLLEACLRSAAAALGRPGAWPLSGWKLRAWGSIQSVAAWGYLWLRLRPGEPWDVVVLVLAGIVLGVRAILHLVREGGPWAIVSRFVAPAPVTALGGVDLELSDGLYGLLGPNGAGKSTLMRLVVNLYRPTRGLVLVNGHELSSNAASLQPRIGYLPQFFGVPPKLTAREYLNHQALLAGKTDRGERAALVESVLAEVGLSDRADEQLGGYSGGMRQRVGIARTLLNVPRIVVVDEPTVGLDPRERIRFRNLLAQLAKTRIVLLSTHVVEDIGSACREVVVLDRGRMVFRGSPKEMVSRAEGRAWIADVPESELREFSRSYRVVSSTRLEGGGATGTTGTAGTAGTAGTTGTTGTTGGLVRVRGVGEAPEGAEQAQPTLEDAYLLMLGRGPRELDDAA